MTKPRPGSGRLMRRFKRKAARVRARAVARATAHVTPVLSGRKPWFGTARKSPWLRRCVLLAVLLAVVFVPYPTQNAPALVAASGCKSGCRTAEVNMLRWAKPLLGQWDLDSGLAGTVSAGGPAYAAVADGVAVVGTGLNVYAYSASDGASLWQDTLNGFPQGAAIVSVRSWPGEVTVGVSFLGKHDTSERNEVVISDATGIPADQYPSAPFGGAVAATSAYTVIVGPQDVTSYDNANGKIRWQRPTGDVEEDWQIDGQYLYMAESVGGDLSAAPVTALRRIDTVTGAEQQILPQPGAEGGTSSAFDGTLDEAFDGTVLFSAPTGVIAYSGATGIELWSVPGTVPEGADPLHNQIYLTRGTTWLAVNPATGRIDATAATFGGGMYVVRDGIALGLDPGASGAAWGYDVAADRVVLSAAGLGWPHYFTDLSGVGGSADPVGGLVIIAACAQAGQPVTATTPSPQGSPGPSGSALSGGAPPSPSTQGSPSTPGGTTTPVQPCARPELVALRL